jgi:cytochrome c-type biogenesis protein CcmH/NrfG
LIFALPLFARDAGLPPAGQRWLTLEQDGLTFVSNALPARTMEIAYKLVGLRRAVQELIGPVPAPLPTTVILFANQKDLAAYREAILHQKTNDSGIVVRNDQDGPFLLIRGDDPSGIAPFLPHTLTHDLIDTAHPFLPLWFREGLAEYFTSYHVTARQPRLGRPILGHMKTLTYQKWLPGREVFSADPGSPLYDEKMREGMFYAESWLFVYTLVKDSSAKRRASLARFIALSDEGATDDAFTRAYDLTAEDLEGQAKAHFKQFDSPIHIRSLRPEIPKLDELPAPRPMPRDDVLFALGSMLVASDPANAPIAERFIGEALRLSPAHARANALRGRMLEEAGHPQEAAKFCEQALRVANGEVREKVEVLLLCSEGVIRRLAKQQDVPIDEVLRARSLFAKAAELDPDSRRAWAGLGATYLKGGDDPAPGIKALRRARSLDPRNENLTFLLAELLARDSADSPEARQLSDALERQAASDQIRLHASHLLTEMDSIEQDEDVLQALQLAQTKVNTNELAGALRVLDAILPRIQDPALLAETRKWRAEIEQRLQRESH